MNNQIDTRIVTRENLFAGTFLFVYALILLVSDPEWLTWAGPIVLGAFPAGNPATPVDAVALETLQAATYWMLPGLLALLILTGIGGRTRVVRRAPPPELPLDGMEGAAHGMQDHRKAA